MSGVLTATSKSVNPDFSISATSSCPPALTAPLFSALVTKCSGQKAITRLVLPTPLGSEMLPRIIWSACLASMPRLKISSTDWSNFGLSKLLTRSMAGSTAIGSVTCFLAASVYRLLRLTVTGMAVRRSLAGGKSSRPKAPTFGAVVCP